MKIFGIIAEYNPLHRGHEYQIKRTRELLGQDSGYICLLDGNFVQRGEAALFNKHARAEAAVHCGADLVLELPLPYALSSAEGFAFGAVSILNRLNCVDYLSFGSESGDTKELYEIADLLLKPEIDELIIKELKNGIPYASARQRAAETLAGRPLNMLTQRNNILGVEYIKALTKLDSSIIPITIKRDFSFHSATELRGLNNCLDKLPCEAAEVFAAEIKAGRGPVRLASLETAILYKLRTMSREEFAGLPDATEGLGDRLFKLAGAESLDLLYKRAATKRYPEARIRRMVINAYLGIKAGTAKAELPNLYARVLAANSKGREIINRIDKAFPVITKPAHGRGSTLFELEAKATDLYVIGYPDALQRKGGSEWTRSPYIEL
jgi:predicted nucleotidyltransferase